MAEGMGWEVRAQVRYQFRVFPISECYLFFLLTEPYDSNSNRCKLHSFAHSLNKPAINNYSLPAPGMMEGAEVWEVTETASV